MPECALEEEVLPSNDESANINLCTLPVDDGDSQWTTEATITAEDIGEPSEIRAFRTKKTKGVAVGSILLRLSTMTKLTDTP